MFGAIFMSNNIIPEDGSQKAEPPPATAVQLPKPIILTPISGSSSRSKSILDQEDKKVVGHVRRTFALTNVKVITGVAGTKRKQDVQVLRELGVTATDFLSLEEVLNKTYLPPPKWSSNPNKPPSSIWEDRVGFDGAILTNGVPRPDQKRFYALYQELSSDLKDVYHSIRRDRPKPGYNTVSVKNSRKFWIALNAVGNYWDTSLDPPNDPTMVVPKPNIVMPQVPLETGPTPNTPKRRTKFKPDKPPTTPKAGTDAMDIDPKDSSDEMEPYPESQPNTYTGRRTSTGRYMDPALSMDLIEAFLEPIMGAFGCHFTSNPMPGAVSTQDHTFYLVDSAVSCQRTRLIYSQPKEAASARQGILEGPIAVVEASGQYAEDGQFNREDADHLLKDLKSLLLCAQQRSREDKPPFEPGHGKDWLWPYRPRWEISGKPLTDLDLFPDPKSVKSANSLKRANKSKLSTKSKSLKRTAAKSDTRESHAKSSVDDKSRMGDGPRDYDVEKTLAWVAEIAPHKGGSSPSTDAVMEDQPEDVDEADGDIPMEDTPSITESISSTARQWMSDKGSEDASGGFTSKELPPEDASGGSTSKESSSAAETSSTSSKKGSVGRYIGCLKRTSIPMTAAVADTTDTELPFAIVGTNSGWSSPSSSSSSESYDPNEPWKVFKRKLDERVRIHRAIAWQRDTSSRRNEYTRQLRKAKKQGQKWYARKLKELREADERAAEKKQRDQESIALQKPTKTGKPWADIFPVSNKNKSKKIGVHPFDTHEDIYLITIVNYHVAFVSTRLHKDFVEWLSPATDEHAKVAGIKKDPETWWGIPVKRSRWYNLFDAGDRCEALRGAWAIFGRMMADKQSDMGAAVVERNMMFGGGELSR